MMNQVTRPHKFSKYHGTHGAEIFCEFCGLVVHKERYSPHHEEYWEKAKLGCPTSNLLTAAEQVEIEKAKAEVSIFTDFMAKFHAFNPKPLTDEKVIND